jgi:8-oxo-dGTP pyrophosphatase MutT (NUDIX family)
MELLVICKRFTYAFNTFLHGRYVSHDNEQLIQLFNGMTIDEKQDILSLSFRQMWYRVWLSNTLVPPPAGRRFQTHFYAAKCTFETTFLADGGKRLRQLINASHQSTRIWEIPKGHRHHRYESDAHCAIREFNEETGMKKHEYRLLPGKTKTHSYVDEGVRYTNTYFIAHSTTRTEPKILFSQADQVAEISDIRWADMATLRILDPTGRLSDLCRPIFHCVKKHTKT